MNPTDFSQDDGDDVYSYRRLLDLVVESKELIVTIPTDSVESLKKNFATLKSRDNAKLKTAGLVPSDDVLSYKELLCSIENCSRIHITLGPRQGVKVIKMELPDDKF